MKCPRTSTLTKGGETSWWLLARMEVYLVTGPGWQNSELLLNFTDGEYFAQLTLQFGNFFATLGQRRDPWTQRLGEEKGVGSIFDNAAMLENGKGHVVSLRGSAVVVRELNLYNILHHSIKTMDAYRWLDWFCQKPSTSWLGKVRDLFSLNSSHEQLLIPIPASVAVTPWSYDDTTWHDFVADTCNWMVYAGNEYCYKSMSFRLGKTECKKLQFSKEAAKRAPRLLVRAPVYQPVRRIHPHPGKHQRICKIAAHPAY
ncbi:hypothetical protein GNI_060500 [Gregarina niphandrodes]|uniref:Uncharacterized protein n=1 Tax=Gregarina niphandrodes TaxID=110365 RepID=A0A023B8J0_GRENI|nr:hypothetical protein GNI_060500 [Gregarina niphandrodes]EZG68994.1 hypothetical protein GNI_060500 [Gregarina niphandrodes]|eukprot:XP_011134512.1 hypothetical protein GNI_060500 [Gregarina niphandrodes]